MMTTVSSKILDGELDVVDVLVGCSAIASDGNLWCFPSCNSMDLMTSVILCSTVSNLW